MHDLPSPELHTPYGGKSPPFTIGLSNIDPKFWIEVDSQLREYLLEKEQLARELPDLVFAAEPETLVAQQEVLDLLCEHLVRHFPERFHRRYEHMVIEGIGEVSLRGDAGAPLRTAARLVQEDLLLMRKGQQGWRLAAGSLSFPSSWRLRDKFGKPMPEIHAPVPGFGPGSRNIGPIQRMFDSLRTEHVFLRWNWGLYDGPERYHPSAGNGMRHLGEDGDPSHLYIRIERQTVRKLPKSGDVLFTIRTHLNPF